MFQVIIRYEDDKNITPYPDSNDDIYYVERKHIRNFLLSHIKLHHTPGINPYNGKVTPKLSYMSICELRFSEGYWWTSPTLDDEKKTPFYQARNFRSQELQDKRGIIYMNALVR